MDDAIPFLKLSGSGNDFICIDNRQGRFDEMIATGQAGHFVRTLCRRGLSVGADGVIFAEASDLLPDVKLFARFYDPDGTQAELCGNGSACFVHWALAEGWMADEVRVMTAAGVVHGRRTEGSYVRVCLPTPEDIRTGLEVRTDERTWLCDVIVTGIPHLVTFVDDVQAVEVSHWGPRLRNHPMFAPGGVNVNFVQVLSPGRLAIRTFEFGVENETLACGTGCASAAILAAIRFGWGAEFRCATRPIRLRAQSGDELRVYFCVQSPQRVTDVCLETIVRPVYAGELAPEMAAWALGTSPQPSETAR